MAGGEPGPRAACCVWGGVASAMVRSELHLLQPGRRESKVAARSTGPAGKMRRQGRRRPVPGRQVLQLGRLGRFSRGHMGASLRLRNSGCPDIAKGGERPGGSTRPGGPGLLALDALNQVLLLLHSSGRGQGGSLLSNQVANRLLCSQAPSSVFTECALDRARRSVVLGGELRRWTGASSKGFEAWSNNLRVCRRLRSKPNRFLLPIFFSMLSGKASVPSPLSPRSRRGATAIN